jgi:predicted MFS family arabinose efflux permease
MRYAYYHHCFIGLLTIAALFILMPNVEARQRNSKKVSCRYLKPEAWLVDLIIGTGGLFCWISYIARC